MSHLDRDYEIECERNEISEILSKHFLLNDEKYDASDFEWAAYQLQLAGFHRQPKDVVRCEECKYSKGKDCSCSRLTNIYARNETIDFVETHLIYLEYCSYGERSEE